MWQVQATKKISKLQQEERRKEKKNQCKKWKPSLNRL